MRRECSHCHTPFRPQDLAREESKGMEAERKALGLQGVRFLYYTCGQCRYNDIFVDIHPLPEESPEEFQIRRDALEATVRELHGDHVDVVVVEK
jgi:hypothetical protein